MKTKIIKNTKKKIIRRKTNMCSILKPKIKFNCQIFIIWPQLPYPTPHKDIELHVHFSDSLVKMEEMFSIDYLQTKSRDTSKRSFVMTLIFSISSICVNR